jgi:hypothetical protein
MQLVTTLNAAMITEDTCLQKYEEFKRSRNGDIPEYREFLKYAGIDKRKLTKLFGASAYSKLQSLAGDTPNKLQMERMPFSTIMEQYGNLVAEIGVVPPYGEWDRRDLKPTDSGLRAKPHGIRWSEMPERFVEWVTANDLSGFEKALRIIDDSVRPPSNKPKNGDFAFNRVIKDVRGWIPARRRNSEAEYKIELRKHLESLNHQLNEEYGESKFDLLSGGEFAIELKKAPDQSEYDRLFGQIARHLQHKRRVIVLILEATRKDKFDNFTMLVDRFLNVHENSVEVIGR